MVLDTEITAHSGCDHTPDNSMEHVRHALTLSVDAFEIDIHKAQDGTLVICHDSVSDEEYMRSPRLKDVFLLLKTHPSMRINCDLKDNDIELDVLRLARECGVTERVIFSGSFNPALSEHEAVKGKVRVFYNVEEINRTLREQYKNLFHGELVAGTPAFDAALDQAADSVIHTCRQRGFDIINIHYGVCTDRFIEKMHENGIGISVWTVNDEGLIRHFLEKKVVNITTRKPTLALSIKAGLAD